MPKHEQNLRESGNSSEETSSPRNILSGVYQHYKGEYYLVLGLAHHSETNEKLVVYVPLYVREGPRISVRPVDMFFEDVSIEGTKQPRFKYIGPEIPNASGTGLP